MTDSAPGHVSKVNGLFYNKDVYDNDGWGGTTPTKAKEDGEGRSSMRRCVDNIANEIIKVLVGLIDEGGHDPVLLLTMTVSVRSRYTHRLVV